MVSLNKKKAWEYAFPKVLVSIGAVLSFYLFLTTWIGIIRVVSKQLGNDGFLEGWFIFNIPFGWVYLIISSAIVVFVWLLSTRVSLFKKKIARVILFFIAIGTIWGNLAAYGMKQTKDHLIPYFQERFKNIIETDGFFEKIVLQDSEGFYLTLLVLPLIVMLFISLFVLNKYVQFDKELNAAFFDFEWNGKWLQKFARMEQKEIWPDIELGEDLKTGEMVVLPGGDRTLNTSIVGSIGTGKTSALGIPILNQDLHHMTRFINEFPHIFSREDYVSEHVAGRYLNGISVIDPSNDLCQKMLKLAKAHGIPDEAITYINPEDPNTPNINPMRGPVDKVAEVFAQVLAELDDSKEGGNFFFQQAQRIHLKQHIYLLKLHNPEKEVTFDMLIDMYNNPQLVRQMHVALKKRIPKDIETIENRDERNYWKIVKNVDEWFDLNLRPKETRQGTYERDEHNNIVYYDAKAEHVEGLRNILNDIASNPLVRRVLFGTSDFDYDLHMELGGLLLVNTAKGQLVKLANVLGKIVLMNLQFATMRRKPQVSTFHHILVDEAPDYLYNAFREFPAQSRKYKVIITTLKQTIAQLADRYGERYMDTIIGSMRNRMVYGDVPTYDAKYFSEMFGEKETFEEGHNEMSVSPLQENPMSRTGFNYSKVKKEAMSTGEIIFQDAFQCTVKIVAHNKPLPVKQIKANFVPREEFERAKVVVNEESLSIWLDERRKLEKRLRAIESSGMTSEIKSIEETELENKEYYQDGPEVDSNELQEQELQKAISIQSEPHPRPSVKFEYSTTDPSAAPVTTIEREVKEKVQLESALKKEENSISHPLYTEMELPTPSSKHNEYQPSNIPNEQKKLIDTLFKEYKSDEN